MNPQQQPQHHDYYDVDDDAHNHPSYCPSFRTYSTNPATHDIASRLVSDVDDFEFTALVNGLPGSSPVYPVFNRDLIRDHGSPVQLGKLFSDEDDEVHLKGASPETYCLWAPKSPEMASPSPGRCMKSSSTGSSSSSSSKSVSKTWKLRNLLRRCKSDGKEGLMLVTDTPPRKTAKSPQWGGGSSGSGKEATTAAAGRRKSYLPYKQDLLGFFGSPQALRKINIPPF